MSIMKTYISLWLRFLSVCFMALLSDKVIVSDGHKGDERPDHLKKKRIKLITSNNDICTDECKNQKHRRI